MGHTHVRRLLFPLALATVVLVGGCGDERPDDDGATGSTFSAAPTMDPTPSATPTAAPTATTEVPSGPLAGFPLDLGYEHVNGDDHSPVAVTDQPATRAFSLCNHPVWDPHRGTTDVIGVEFRGEAEWARGRTLVLYPTEDAAADAVNAGHDAVAGCPEDQADGAGNATAHTLLDVSLGDQSVVWIDRFRSADLGGHFDTGLVVYQLVRVGPAVLLSYEYGEGNGSDESRDQSVAEATDGDRPVVDEMRSLPLTSVPTAGPAGDAFTMTPRGAGPFELGMSIERARHAAANVVVDEEPRLCPQLSWTDRSGVHVHGAFSPGVGLAYLSTDGGTTTEGVAVGGTLAELRAAYPNLVHDNGLWSSDQGATSYAFELGRAHTIDWMLVIDKDQRCAS